MKNTINPMKAIAIIGAVSVLIVGGYILGHSIFTANSASDEDMAAVVSPSPIPENTYDFSIEVPSDGIVGKDISTETPEASGDTEAAQNSAAPEAPATKAPAGTNNNGSSGTSAPSGTNSGTTNKPVSSTPSSPSSSGGSSDSSAPAAGSTNSSGQVYVPGFGYVTPSTSGNSQTTSHGDGDGTIVGTMG